MVMMGYGRNDYSPPARTRARPARAPAKAPAKRQPTQRRDGDLVAHIGEIVEGRLSTDSKNERVEKLYTINDELLCYNKSGNRVLVKCSDNDAKFNEFVEMPFTKGVTELGSGRTMLILGSDAHHGEAMQGQFSDVIWDDEDLKGIQWGYSMRWINVGTTELGFIGLDYNPNAEETDGVARHDSDLGFLARRLVEAGFCDQKKMYLLQPPHIKESHHGAKMRERGFHLLGDYMSLRL